jgi:hypothetical protein
MEIKLTMKILQVTVTIDEARQNGPALDVNDLSAGGNSDIAASTDCLDSARLDNDNGIVDRRPAGTVNQLSPLHNEYFFYHDLFPLSLQSADSY